MNDVRAIPPPRCPHVRGWKFSDLIDLIFYDKVDRQCCRYSGHEKFGYKCQDNNLNEWAHHER